MTKNTFPKKERLCSKISIAELFANGQSIRSGEIKITHLKTDLSVEDQPIKVIISVPKRNIRLAVNRNQVKRRIRAAYIKHKNWLFSQLNAGQGQVHLAIIYTHHQPISYAQIEDKIFLSLQRLVDKYGEGS